MEEIDPFPYFTRFLEDGLSGTIAYRHTSCPEQIKTGWAGPQLVQRDMYVVILRQRTRTLGFGFPLQTSEEVIGTINNTLTGSPDELYHYYVRTTVYDGKLPNTSGEPTWFNRKLRVVEHPETMTADLPVVRKVSQPWFYDHKFPRWIFAYVMSPEQETVEAKRN